MTALATSSIGGRRWQRGDRTLHPVIDPRTGTAAQSDLHSVTVRAPTAMMADVAAKVVLVLAAHRAPPILLERGLSGLLTGVHGHEILVGNFRQEEAAVGFASLHGLVLMGDRCVSFPIRAIPVPFAASYEPLLVACGQVALWLSVLLIGSFHVRRHIGGRAWRQLHCASFVAFWMAVVHGLALGSESATLWASFLYLGTAAPVTFLSLHRVLSTERIHGLLVGGAATRQPA